MADITTVEGLRVLFDPAAISAVANSDGQAGAAGTVIYGLLAEGVTVGESASALLQRLNLTSSFAKLTRLGGSPVLINCKSVSLARQPASGEYPAEIRSLIFAGAIKQAVRESLDEVKQAINRAGGNF